MKRFHSTTTPTTTLLSCYLVATSVAYLMSSTITHGFVPTSVSSSSSIRPFGLSRLLAENSETTEQVAPEVKQEAKVAQKQLGLLTFDLDDTLYPIAPVVEEANAAFVKAMERFGYTGLSPTDIVTTAKEIREEIADQDPEKAAGLSHTEIRELAIRREMEKIIYKQKLKETADDWATQLDSLSPLVMDSAKKWAANAVSKSVVDAVLSAWEMERHHAAERHLYPEVVSALQAIKQTHPGVIIGAVTDGRANPMLMTFTLAKFFDFCVSWEDEQGSRRKFFKELDSVDGNTDLTWIYDAARHKYATLKQAAVAMDEGMKDPELAVQPLVYPDTYDDLVWIHVGDDLAFDVGGSKACGAKTVLVELPRGAGQTAPFRFDPNVPQPAWATTSKTQLETRIRLNDCAREMVDVKINSLERLPIVINDLVFGEN